MALCGALGHGLGHAAPSAAAAADPALRSKPAAPPQRIVSLLPSLTETVCALGACGRLVGTDRWSNAPAAVRALPKLGGLDDAQVEAIVALKPDLVLLAGSTRALDRLAGLGLPVAALEPRSLADVRQVTRQVAGLLGLPASQAESLWQAWQREIDAAARRLDPAAQGLSVYHEVGAGPYAASAGAFTGELLARLGLVNTVPASLGPYPQLNPEFVVRADPALILVSQDEVAALRARPGWGRIRAVREQRICRLDADARDLMARPGPRIGETAAALVSCINTALAAAAASHAAPR